MITADVPALPGLRFFDIYLLTPDSVNNWLIKRGVPKTDAGDSLYVFDS